MKHLAFLLSFFMYVSCGEAPHPEPPAEEYSFLGEYEVYSTLVDNTCDNRELGTYISLGSVIITKGDPYYYSISPLDVMPLMTSLDGSTFSTEKIFLNFSTGCQTDVHYSQEFLYTPGALEGTLYIDVISYSHLCYPPPCVLEWKLNGTKAGQE